MCVSDVMHDCDFAYEIDLVDDFFSFSGAPIACVSRPITFVFDLVRCVKICRSWDSNSRPLGQKSIFKSDRPAVGTLSSCCWFCRRHATATNCRLRLISPPADCIFVSDTRL